MKLSTQIFSKKALEAPSNVMVLVIFIVFLAILIMLLLIFGTEFGAEDSTFQRMTNFSRIFSW